MKISEIIEFEKDDSVTSSIYWVSAALTKNKHDTRPHIKFVFSENGVFTATDGSRLHSYKPANQLFFCKDGFYSVIKRNKTNVILKFEGNGEYPETESLLSTVGFKTFDEPFYAEIGYCSHIYAKIVRAMKTGTIDYKLLEGVFSTGDQFDCFIKDAKSQIIFKNSEKTAAIMPMLNID